jgi:hypothetical protein
MLKLELNLDEVNIILAGLGKLPFESVFRLVKNLEEQLGPQLKEQQDQQPSV